MCCDYFEKNQNSTVDAAYQALHGSFRAVRQNQEYYERLTLENARKKRLERSAEQAPGKSETGAEAMSLPNSTDSLLKED